MVRHLAAAYCFCSEGPETGASWADEAASSEPEGPPDAASPSEADSSNSASTHNSASRLAEGVVTLQSSGDLAWGEVRTASGRGDMGRAARRERELARVEGTLPEVLAAECRTPVAQPKI